MSRRPLPARALVASAVLFTAACNDPAGTHKPFDPTVLTAAVQQLHASFQAPQTQSFIALNPVPYLSTSRVLAAAARIETGVLVWHRVDRPTVALAARTLAVPARPSA